MDHSGCPDLLALVASLVIWNYGPRAWLRPVRGDAGLLKLNCKSFLLAICFAATAAQAETTALDRTRNVLPILGETAEHAAQTDRQ